MNSGPDTYVIQYEMLDPSEWVDEYVAHSEDEAIWAYGRYAKGRPHLSWRCLIRVTAEKVVAFRPANTTTDPEETPCPS